LFGASIRSDAAPALSPTTFGHRERLARPGHAQQGLRLTSQTRLVILNSPSNPTGAAYTRQELESFGRVLDDWPNVVVVADDIYDRIYWADESCVGFAAACPSLRDRTVSVNGVSKAYAMTGWRLGYAAGPVSLVKAMNVIQSQSTSNACTVSQAAAVAALTGDQAPVSAMTAAYRARHDRFVSGLNELDGVDCNTADGAFYAFPNVAGAISHLGLTSSVEFAETLIERAGVASVPGEPFGAPGHLRLSFACSEAELDDALARIKRLLAA
jgi:aspartate aminotransferase